jgi:heme/copper-type cytochrome/quinol oxidase subunit 2
MEKTKTRESWVMWLVMFVPIFIWLVVITIAYISHQYYEDKKNKQDIPST